MDGCTRIDGRKLFDEDRTRMLADHTLRRIYEEEAAKKGLWLQLVEARQAAGLTQAEVARRLGVSQAQVSRIEKSKTPKSQGSRRAHTNRA
ncbi:MAG: helix-turn-helix domain-containing protein [Chloroflexi bacterium]|nr:helix-turn-helix domain-containing protein [Chloroflexota bacterium]